MTTIICAPKPPVDVPARSWLGNLPAVAASTEGLGTRRVKSIQLTQGKVALVDAEDFDALNAVKWCAHRQRRAFYAMRSVLGPGFGWKNELMHRLVLTWKLGRDIAPGMQCDHDDGDGLNNTRSNLFEVTKRGNLENKHVAKTSRFVGVSQDRLAWRAQIVVAGKRLHLGNHATELEAAKARENYIEAHPELGARSNFPKATP